MHLHRSTAAAVLLLALAVLVGCSADKPEATTPRSSTEATTAPSDAPPSPNPRVFLTASDVEQYPPGSPARAVFDFWLEVQYRDILSAYESLTPEFRKGYAGSLKRFGEYVMADYPRWLTKPKLLFVRANGAKATVAVSYRSVGGVTERSSFSLRRAAQGWTVAYDFYLANRLTAE